MRKVALITSVFILATSAHANSEAPSRIAFVHECDVGQRVRLAAVGDLLFHNTLEKEALAEGGSYRQFWNPVQSAFDDSDIVYGNLEGTVANDIALGGLEVREPGRRADTVYAVPDWLFNFNYHPSLIDDLIASGFKIVSTANNHALDRGILGVARTIDNLRSRGLKFSGTSKGPEIDGPFSTSVQIKGFRLAFVACTAFTNAPDSPATHVLRCYDQRERLISEIRKLSADATIDAVIFTPHWGIEYAAIPDTRQRTLARDAVKAGADLIIGTHPHTLQPWEKIEVDGREALVIYSTGNFISGMQSTSARRGIIVLVWFVKLRPNGKALLASAGYIQTRVEFPPYRVTEDKSNTDPILPPPNRLTLRMGQQWRDLCGDRGLPRN